MSLAPSGGRGAVRRAALVQLFRAHPVRAGSVAALALGGGVLTAAFALLVGRVVAALPGAVRHGAHSPDGRAVVRALVLLAVVLLAQEVAVTVRGLVATDLYRRFDEHLLGRVLAAATALPGLDLFDDPEPAALRDRAARAARFGPGELVSGLDAKWGQQAGGLASAVLLGWYWPLAGAVLGVLWLAAGLQVQANRYRHDPFWSDPLRRAEHIKRLGLLPAWAKEQRIFGLAAWTADRFGREWAAVTAELWRVRRVGTGRLAAVGGALFAAHAVLLGLLAAAALRGDVAAAELSVVLQALLGTAALAGQDGDVWIENGAVPVPDVLALERTVRERSAALPRGTAAAPAAFREIRFEGVSYRYPGRAEPVFEGLDLRIAGGCSLAVVGLNGAGKTTLTKLLTGLARPTAGRITVDGTDLAEIADEAWRLQLAAVFQDFVRYPLPARENIAFGAAGSPPDDGELWEAARRAGAAGSVEALPHGLDTVLSRRYAGGVDLSGGQWQRLALARALHAVRHGARLLVLDEPTAQLDVRAEADLFERFLELTQGLTTLLISHRFSTVRRADRIVVLDGGRIIEDGSHDVLVAAGGRYASLFRAQAARFAEGGGHV